ncbi:MAG: hypothetical protein Q8Q60_02310 [Candidatus Chromulinivorax sp.]|nr:hypothetical protein [Candidatus Chromulinivorax sp.]
MKNIGYQQNVMAIQHKLALMLVCVLASLHHTIQGCENVFLTAEMLTQSSHTALDLQKIISLFPHENTDKAIPYIPSIQEIITKISQLQNSQGLITDKQTKQLALDVLKIVIQATDNALSLINFQSKDYELGIILRHQNKILHIKMRELNQKSTWEYLTKSPAFNAAVACILTTLVIAGITYYFDVLDLGIYQAPPLPTGSIDNQTTIVYNKINVLLHKFLDPQDKAPLSMYIAESKKLREQLQLNPENNTTLIDVLNTVIESENRMDYGFGSMQQIKNDLFWVNILRKKNYYTSVFNQISQRNIDDMDFKQLWIDKGWI